ncbi:hypothetical protein A2773_02050 [Candidatus Gottesmanbacteria bacterium RIFCSPHIGHO2_01_FULL_39_10]|uniref:Uncharacterized protein n=1 Tax=Candidatus Gottesmanbacteria bacterium RIFCSPHIGHO2_01_FULL_39_10 TaxID=1798375 RepID=A0A1F5ZRK9_9BACT|nr:MAG: hypothetical protein A2773_02050 [Candidatus Gottesmanbacteria bacterium RIFCSPHIGHO2_01_FULL_39_10]
MVIKEIILEAADDQAEPQSDGRGGYRLTQDEINMAKIKRELDDLVRTEPVPPTEKPTEFDDGIPL